MSAYFLKQKALGGNVRVELDLSNYATKVDLEKTTGVDALQLAKKVDLAGSKTVPTYLI